MDTTQYRHLIAGRWEGEAGTQNINPSDTTDIVGMTPSATAEEIKAAISAADDAREQWAQATPQQRFEVLDRAGAEILARVAELGTLLAREEGKPIKEAIGEVTRAGQLFKFFAGECLRLSGEIIPSVRPGMTVEIVREPVGVVGVITPWNFPIAIPAWKIAPALAWGNTVVFKPAGNTPGCAWELANILTRAGLPAGVLNLVYGSGSQVGAAMTESGLVNAISFTGSVGVGNSVAKAAAEHGIRVQTEMGGKNPMVILDDADLELAVEVCINGAYFSTGQRCTASSRLIVTDGIHDEFVGALEKRMRTLTVGNALDPQTIIGPVVDQTQLDQDRHYIELAASEGGDVIGGEILERATTGFYLSPALVKSTTPDMTINREEVFGPVASVIRVADYEEALSVANDTAFGLSSGICSTSLKLASHFKRHAQAGMVMVNAPTAGVDYHVPFGGTKASSYGAREQGSYAKEFYSTTKTIYTNP
ncbi:aldehyde dehydrogenase family protein [Pseudarthrobacter sp. NamE2]|uniref:aldehyde dehydrogenase family protein n=1 Tax=Pseudarthrobacter sp. NamE2 TaxID=2576838 RepID=UPI0010FE4CDC|nr:aldehyde dehydrogenase family protein [Pseudarthrobacter sp. NamE2]TLM80992.1 aldehyde dehydrogenase family protein [Pseudarthrobacter sp. NamE2]